MFYITLSKNAETKDKDILVSGSISVVQGHRT